MVFVGEGMAHAKARGESEHGLSWKGWGSWTVVSPVHSPQHQNSFSAVSLWSALRWRIRTSPEKSTCKYPSRRMPAQPGN